MPEDHLPPVLEAIRQYQVGSSRGALLISDEAVGYATDHAEFRSQLEQGLLGLLGENLSTVAKEHVCRQLAAIGSEASAPALVGLLSHPPLVTAAATALAALPGDHVPALLRADFPKLPELAKVAVLDVLGRRRDEDSIPLLAGLAGEKDARVAEAALAALGAIGSGKAAATLHELGSRQGGKPASAFVDAALVCAERAGAGAAEGRRLLEWLRAQPLPPYQREAVARALGSVQE